MTHATQPLPTTAPPADRPALSSLWALGAMVNFTVMIVCIRYVSDTLTPFDISFFRGAIGVVFMLPFFVTALRSEGLRVFRARRPGLMMLRGVLTYIAVLAWVYAVANMVLADAVALNATIPLWTVVLAAFVLGETVTRLRWIVTLVGFAGVLVILRPGFVEVGWPAILALVSAFFYGASGNVAKLLTRTESPNSIVLYTNLVLALVAAGPALYVWNPPSWEQVPLVLGVGVAGTLAHLCITRAYKLADASFVGPFDFVRMVLVTIAGYVLFGEAASLYVWIGAAMVIGSTVYLARVEAKAA